MNRGSEKLEQDINVNTFQLGCTPAINLFEQTAEPIALDLSRHEYRVVPDVANQNGMEVYSVDQVTGVDPISGRTTEYQPFYSFRHGARFEEQQTFWYATRRPSLQPTDRGTEVHLSLVDLGFDPRLPAESTLVVRTTCTNRELPLILQKAGERLALELEAAAPLRASAACDLPRPLCGLRFAGGSTGGSCPISASTTSRCPTGWRDEMHCRRYSGFTTSPIRNWTSGPHLSPST